MTSVLLLAAYVTASVAVDEAPSIRLVAAPASIRAEYSLGGPTTAFQFAVPLPAEARVQIQEPQLTFSPAGVEAPEPFTNFALNVRPDRVRMDARYPVATRLADGWMIHLPSLVSAGDVGLSDFEFSGPEGWALVSGPGERPLDGLVYFGPPPEEDPDMTFVSDPGLPDWIETDVRRAALDSLSFFEGLLDVRPPTIPMIFLGLLTPEDPMFYVGDVSPNGVINLQFSERVLSPERDERFMLFITSFVAHETFHLWQGDKYIEADGVNGRWLNEGAAEYFSLLAQAQMMADGPALLRGRLAQNLDRCLTDLSDEGRGLLDLEGHAAEATRYACGTVVHWIVDLQLRDSGGAAALWRSLLDTQGGYGVAEFRSLASNGADHLAALFEGDESLQSSVLAALNGLGAEVQLVDAPPEAWATAALWPLLESSCVGQLGVLTEAERFYLDTGERCGALSGDPEAVAVAGHSLSADSRGAFSAVETACARGEGVSVRLRDGASHREVQVGCRFAPSAPPMRYRVVRAH